MLKAFTPVTTTDTGRIICKLPRNFRYNVEEFKKLFNDNLYGNTDIYLYVEAEIKKKTYSSETIRTYNSQLTKLKKFKSKLLFSELSKEFVLSYKNI